MITFSLITRDAGDGEVAIVLYLFRNDEVASVTTIATVPRSQATMVLIKSRVHLRRQGVQDANEAYQRKAG
ncbi:MAG TPA: hypothetical protein VH414_00550 [Lichenihabitans sp.]|jgi:hypothetical protein|nr:hypothetical protein [Lichenihabitans sp.]